MRPFSSAFTSLTSYAGISFKEYIQCWPLRTQGRDREGKKKQSLWPLGGDGVPIPVCVRFAAPSSSRPLLEATGLEAPPAGQAGE